MTKIAYLFPDTNFFEQCRAALDLDWSAWKDFDEVHLIVSRPIIAEIDQHKNKGSDRLSKRARATNSMFGEILDSGLDHKQIREAAPQVKIFLRQDLKPNPDLTSLDYETSDDQLVGIAHAFAAGRADGNVYLVTHDIGPRLTAESVGLPCLRIPADWLLPPESSETDKKIAVLNAEIDRLRKAEPKVEVEFFDSEGQQSEIWEFEIIRYAPLSDQQVGELIEALKKRHPVAQDFGPREAPPSEPIDLVSAAAVATQFFGPRTFVPAAEDAIEAYRTNAYPQWLKNCEATLRSLHDLLNARQGAPRFSFSALNEGARPANDVLVTIAARGNFQIAAIDDDEDEPAKIEPIALSPPPTAPRGRWHVKTYSDALSSIARLATGVESFNVRPFPDHLGNFLRRPPTRESDAFYWKPSRPDGPVAAISFECEQWRHGMEPELFVAGISFDRNAETIEGILECSIHAENLSDKIVKGVPVRGRLRHAEAFDEARLLVAEC